MNKVLYYVTDHGLGHATRSIAIIRELHKQGIEVYIRNLTAYDFLKKSLPFATIIPGRVDVGPYINNDGISINVSKSRKKIEEWIQKLDKTSSNEVNLIEKIKPDLVVSDVSVLPIIAAKKNRIKSVIISNFSWYDVLDFVSKKFKDYLYDAYKECDLAIKLPLGTSMKHFSKTKKFGLVCRVPTINKEKLKNKLGLSNSDRIVLFALGGSTNIIKCKISSKIKILSMNTRIQKNLYPLNVDRYTEGQNLVSISDLVICKCGYGILSECLSNQVPFNYIADYNHLEQKAISKELIKKGFHSRLSFNQLEMLEINEDYLQFPLRFKKEPIENVNVCNQLVKML